MTPTRAKSFRKRAVELRPSLVDLARDDSDLDPLRGQPAFKELVDIVST
ncbi:MAG TPA: hypothetical protein VMD48_09035 [Solirubrobacteraceae bacterium]|nr:hypothetical protein [Solirubrobacteraceae bacterium]